jgi:hypothetical protein
MAKNPLIYILGSASCLFFALHSKQTNLGAITSSFGGAILAQAAMSKTSKRFPEDELKIALSNSEVSKPKLEAQIIPNTTTSSISKYDWNQIVEENCLLIGGEPGSAKTSVVAGFIVPKISHAYKSEIIVLDSHAKKNNWQGMGYNRVVSDYEEIYECLLWLDEERERRRNSSDSSHLIICIFDEINDMWSYLERFDKQNRTKRLSNAQLILQTLLNCRKFDILIIGMMQSHLCEDIGLSGAIRRQAMILLLNGAAREEASRNKKKLTNKEYSYLTNKNMPYCCLITGYQSVQIADHPTHGSYPVFAKKGKEPKNVSKPKAWEIISVPFAKLRNDKYSNKIENLRSNIIITKAKKFNPNEEGVSNEDEREEAVLLTPEDNNVITQLESILQKSPINLTPLTLIPNGWVHIDPIAGELSTEVRGLLVELINVKCSKKEAIKLVFGVTKGTSKKYKAASYWYEEIKEQIK